MKLALPRKVWAKMSMRSNHMFSFLCLWIHGLYPKSYLNVALLSLGSGIWNKTGHRIIVSTWNTPLLTNKKNILQHHAPLCITQYRLYQSNSGRYDNRLQQQNSHFKLQHCSNRVKTNRKIALAITWGTKYPDYPWRKATKCINF